MPREQRADIDGLKGLAIIAVVLFHFSDIYSLSLSVDAEWLSGGFLGVDVFLVITGYLLTASILGRLNNQSFSLLNYYKSRFTRLYPALAVICFISLLLGYFLLYPKIFMELASEIVSTFTTVGNFRFANTGGYFGLSSVDKPLLHTWYICISMHFYLLYPLILLLLFKLNSSRLKYSVLGVFVVFLILAILTGNKDKSYLVTQSRFFEPVFGSLIFCFKDELHHYLEKITRGNYLYVELGALLLLIYGFIFVNMNGRYYTPAISVIPLISTALILVCNSKKTVLNIPVINALGKHSYSIYLCHWPLFVFMARIGLFNTSIILVIVLSLILTFIFYYLFEKHTVSYKATILLMVLCVLPYSHIKKTWGDNYISQFMTLDEDTSSEKEVLPAVEKQYGDIALYRYGEGRPDLFIIGDSHTEQYKSYFDHHRAGNLYFAYNPATMAYGKWIVNSKCHFHHVTSESRHNYFSLYTETLNKLKKGDKVILANNWFIYAMEHECKSLHNITDAQFNSYVNDLLKMFDEEIVLHPELKFYIVGQGIYTSQTIAACSQADFKDSVLKHIINQSYCSTTIDYQKKYTEALNKALSKYAEDRINVEFIDRNTPLVEGDFFKTTFDNKALFRDNHHYTRFGGSRIIQYILEQVGFNRKQEI